MISSLATASLLIVQAFLFWAAYRKGRMDGFKAGEEAAAVRLLRTKNPEVWEVAHAYQHEIDTERNTPAYPFPAAKQ